MSHQRERGFLPAFPPERSHNLVKSAPNLDNKSRSSSSTDNILLGNRADNFSDRMTVVKSTTSMNNSHNYTNTNYHSIFYERDLTKSNNNDNNNDDEKKQTSMTSVSSHNHSNESFEYDSDDSVSQNVSIGCFSFVGNNSSSSDAKKSKSRYKMFGKSHTTPDLDNRQLLSSSSSTITTAERQKTKSSNSRKNSTDPKKKIQFEEFTTPKAQFNVDLMFYKRFEQSLDAVGSHDMSEEDILYMRTKPNKNKLAMRLQKSLDAIDSFDIDDDRDEKVYSKSIDDLSTGSDYQWYRGGSQFTRQCFFKNGTTRNGNGNRDSESSQESSTVRKSSWPHTQY